MLDAVLILLGNYLLILGSIVLFILPFYLLYRFRQAHDINTSFNQHLEYFFSSKYANALVFVWAMGEALVWFVIPEFLLLLIVFMRIKKKLKILVWDVAGTATGTIFALLIHLPKEQLEHLPYVQHNMILQTQTWFDREGILAMIHQIFSGVPYKVFNHLAADYHFFIPGFILFAVIVRISRYYLAYTIFTSLYPVLHKFVYRNYIRLFFAATFIFSVLLLKAYGSFGSGYTLH